jgi:hypothetical protein
MDLHDFCTEGFTNRFPALKGTWLRALKIESFRKPSEAKVILIALPTAGSCHGILRDRSFMRRNNSL